MEGDHRITEESVEVESKVGSGNCEEDGRQDRLVRPASCPTSKASKVTEKCCGLMSRTVSCGEMQDQERVLTFLYSFSPPTYAVSERSDGRLLLCRPARPGRLQMHQEARR